MQFYKYKKPIALSILFFMPVAFLLFLYPSTHNYQPLDIVNENVAELTTENPQLKDQISIVAFFGNDPMQHLIAAANLKELIYDKFKGFKKFQIVVVSPEGASSENEKLRKEISSYEALEYWRFAYMNSDELLSLFNSLKTEESLDTNFSSQHVFIVDKDLNQRGRIDDREENEIEKAVEPYGLYSYDCIEVAELKDKLSEDLRILFTEYRQKRKGNFNSDTRRAQDLKSDEEN